MVLESIDPTGGGTPLVVWRATSHVIIVVVSIRVGTLDPAHQITRIVRFGQNYTRRTRCLGRLAGLVVIVILGSRWLGKEGLGVE